MAGFAAGPTQIAFTWSYTPSAEVPICTDTITANCVDSFTLSEPTTTFSQSIPAVSGTSSYSYNLTPLPATGTYIYTLVANETYSGGGISSDPVTVSVATAVITGPYVTGTLSNGAKLQ